MAGMAGMAVETQMSPVAMESESADASVAAAGGDSAGAVVDFAADPGAQSEAMTDSDAPASTDAIAAAADTNTQTEAVDKAIGAVSQSPSSSDTAAQTHSAALPRKLRRDEWGLTGQPRAALSALLPMGGAVSGVAGPNWMLIGDAAACVNPLNGEGIDYGLETGRLAAELLGAHVRDYTAAWPTLLQEHYARGFSVARRLGLLLTLPRFLPLTGPVAMRSSSLMNIAVRVMGNLVTDEDADWVARAWRGAGRLSRLIDRRAPFT